MVDLSEVKTAAVTDKQNQMISKESDGKMENAESMKNHMISEDNEEADNPFCYIKDIEQAENILSRYIQEYPNDSIGAEDMLDQMLSAFKMNNYDITGNADAFHNFSVTIRKIRKDNLDAFEIVKIGLRLYSDNTDLLADGIQYGSNCGKTEECDAYYNRLKTIDKRWWTWRAFSFSIDYLLKQYSSINAGDHLIEEMVALADEYIEKIPYEEDAWLSKSQIYKSTNNIDIAIKTLEEAMSRSKAGPKCWLEYADIMVDRGEFEKASKVLRLLRRDGRTSKSVNTSYMYYLDALCKMSILMSKPEYDEGEIDEKEVLKVYKAFSAAASMPGLRESISRDIAENITRLEVETDIEDPCATRERLKF